MSGVKDPVTPTNRGPVRGRRERGVLVHQGIPYARSPTGARRFAPPERPDAWSAPLDAQHPGPVAPQPQRAISQWWHGVLPPWDEDCLSLNVWAPQERGDGLPVLVWIHGGGWSIGWGSNSLYDGRELALAGPMVVVTLNYRLGSLGWCHHAAFAPRPGAPAGNWGHLDQVAALRWVQENVANFGGDPGRVTVAGQSAGAASVLHLLAGAGADGLFRRAIVQSPPLGEATVAPVVAERWSEALAERLGAGTGDDVDVDALRAMPAAAVVAAHEQLMGDPCFRGTRGGAIPVPDPATISGDPSLLAAARMPVEILIGTNADEATFFFRAAGRVVHPDDQHLEAMVRTALRLDDASGVVAAYRSRARLSGHPEDANSVLVRIVTDGVFAVPVARWSRARAEAGGRVYRYRVEHPSPEAGLGAVHCGELPLVFGTYPRPGPAQRLSGAGPRAAGASRAMMAAWAAFVKGGDPGWPAAPPGGPDSVMVFGGPAGDARLQTAESDELDRLAP